MERKYAVDEFWIQKLDFKRRVDACAFSNLHEVRSIINNIFLLVVRNNLGSKQVKEWQKTNMGQPPKFCSRINIIEFISNEEASRRKIVYPKN